MGARGSPKPNAAHATHQAELIPPAGATTLSDLDAKPASKLAGLSVLARASLYLAPIALLGGASCLVTSSPEFTRPKRTPPFLTSLAPDIYKFQKVTSAGPLVGFNSQTVSAYVVSEDLGDDLEAVLVQDYQGSGNIEPVPVLLKDIVIEPGHADRARPIGVGGSITFSFLSTIRPGCHSVTLIVTHQFDGRSFSPKPAVCPQPPECQVDAGNSPRPASCSEPLDCPADVAMATWWYGDRRR